MKTVLIFAGTTEGRTLAEIFDASSIPCHVAVATQYGKDVMTTSDLITIHSGRLDEEGMSALYKEIECDVVVDATHPYSPMVTDTIKKSTDKCGVGYIRLLRDNNAKEYEKDVHYYPDVQACIAKLKNTEGNILLTTGSKQIPLFTQDESIKRRIIARVLPGIESLEICVSSGLEGKQIIAAQGPFSKEMNQVTIKDYEIKHLVTRQSGTVGGADTKLLAAYAEGIDVHVISRPDEGMGNCDSKGFSIEKTVELLQSDFGFEFRHGVVNVALAGIGPGSEEMMTEQVKKAVHSADYVFGAKRMLDSVQTSAKKIESYLPSDILPVLETIHAENYLNVNAVVLFSGDTGFFSGCRKMYEALHGKEGISVQIMPGISSISTLASRFGEDYQDSTAISLHGKNRSEWSGLVLESVRHNKKTFFITSGPGDVRELSKLLEKEGLGKCVVKLGYNLSYADEKLIAIYANQGETITDEGLYAGLIINEEYDGRYLSPVMADEEFIRDSVPMTKEAVRKLSVCRLELQEGDVVFDIGSGTGSVAVQIAALSPKLTVFALECEDKALELINKNVRKTGLYNISVINATAPDKLKELPKADKCFIGGSRGNLKQILQVLYTINPKMRVVMNAVSLESIGQMNELLKTINIRDLSIEQVSIGEVRELGAYHMMSANNPVFIFSFTFNGD